jgi:hypothetical protein
MDNNEKNTQMFMYLVGSFEMSAMMALGKMKNPVTGTIEKDMTQAQFSIDILDMLTAKTKGNLSEYEQKFLENTLGQLKLNYLDEAKKDSGAVKPGKEEPQEKKSEDAANKETPEKSA